MSMTGNVMYETSSHPPMPSADWATSGPSLNAVAGRRDKESMASHSPTYSHLSSAETSAHAAGSPYAVPQSIPVGAHPAYPYPSLTGSHLHPMPESARYVNHSATYYPTGAHEAGYDMYSTPAGPSRSSKPYSHAELYQQQQLQHAYDGQQPPLLTTSTLNRTYDTTIPQYYPVTSSNWSQVTPDKTSEGVGQKRKRDRSAAKAGTGKATPPPSAGKLQTPKRAKGSPTEHSTAGRAAKRMKVDAHAGAGAKDSKTVTQLPTPPSTGREIQAASLPQHLRVTVPNEEAAALNTIDEVDDGDFLPEMPERRGVRVTRHEEEGRKLGFSGEEERSVTPPMDLEPRTTTVPALTVNTQGQAEMAMEEVLESEMAWLENGGRAHSPPSSPDLVCIRTPVLKQREAVPAEALVRAVSDDSAASPNSRALKVRKILKAFEQDGSRLEGEVEDSKEMVCTKIDMFGRVAVRKDVALRFLGLDGSARVVEETRGGLDAEEGAEWVEVMMGGGSSKAAAVKPSWPDDMAPWSVAGGSRREKRLREESQKAEVLKRYFEAASDESDLEEDEGLPVVYTGKGKGKSVARLVMRGSVSESSTSSSGGTRRRRDLWDGTSSDARDALRKAVGYRVPSIPAGQIACACGTGSQAAGYGSMISCSSCRTWHHLACCGIEDEQTLGPEWWCSACEARAVALSTPARSTSRAYAQSDERSSAFKGESMANIALAPSPMFISNPSFGTAPSSSATSASHPSATALARTPLNSRAAALASPSSRPHRSRVLSYGTDMWAYTEDGLFPSSIGVTPTTPAPATTRPDRFSTPRIDDAPFDVTSTPSRHLDFNFSQPSLFSLTPLGPGRGARVPSIAHNLLSTINDNTPMRPSRNVSFSNGVPQQAPHTDMVPSKHEFFREMHKQYPQSAEGPATPSNARWPHALMGAHNVSPSPFSSGGGGHRRTPSGSSKLGGSLSMKVGDRRSGLGLGMPLEERDEE